MDKRPIGAWLFLHVILFLAALVLHHWQVAIVTFTALIVDVYVVGVLDKYEKLETRYAEMVQRFTK